MNKELIKKVVMIGLFLGIILGVGFALYWFFFKSEGQQDVVIVDGVPIPVGELPFIGEGLPPGFEIDPDTGLPIFVDVREIEEPAGEPTGVAQGGPTDTDRTAVGDIVGLLSSGSGQVQFYDRQSGTFYRVNDDGTVTAIGDRGFVEVQDVAWSKQGDDAILEFPDGSNIYYNFETGKQVTLPNQMTDFSFSYDGESVAFEWYNKNNPEDNWLGVASPDGSEINFVEPMGENGEKVTPGFSPDSRYIALYSEGVGSNNLEVLPIGQYGENFPSLSVEGRGFESQWSPDGKHMLYSAHSDETGRKPQLWITQVSGDKVGVDNQPLGVETWAHKCAFNARGTSVYCAVPRELPSGVGWFPEFDHEYPDDFYEINLSSGKVSLLAQPVGSRDYYSADSVTLSADGKTLYFVDGPSQDLFNIKLQ